MNPVSVVKIIGNLRYSTDKAILIANDVYSEEVSTMNFTETLVPGDSVLPPHTTITGIEVVGTVYERNGKNRFLYRTEKGRYFLVTQTQAKGAANTLEPLTLEVAGRLYYEELPIHPVEPELALPDYMIEDA